MLKKLVVILAAVAMASNAFAAATVVRAPVLSTDIGTWATYNIKFTPSKSVIMGYTSGIPATDTGTNASVYSIASKNSAGDSLFGATSASTSIVFTKAVGAGGDLQASHVPTLPTDATDSTIAGGAGNWSVL